MEDTKVSLKRFKKLTNIKNAVACRDICNGTVGCYYWTFKVLLLQSIHIQYWQIKVATFSVIEISLIAKHPS